MYIDESYSKNSKYIVLAGTIISEDNWTFINEKIDGLKEAFFKNKDINLKLIRRQKYDKESHFENLSDDQKQIFEKELYNILSENCLIYMSALIDRTKITSYTQKQFLFRLAYSFLIQRFEFFLKENRGRGMIIIDNSKNKEITMLFNYHREIMGEGIPYKRKPNIYASYSDQYEFMDLTKIVENLFFQSDDYSNFLQISDIICSAISTKYNRNNDYYFNKILRNIRKSPAGQLEGWGIKIFPKD